MDANSRVRRMRVMAEELLSKAREDGKPIDCEEFILEFVHLDEYLSAGGEWPWQWTIAKDAAYAKNTRTLGQ